MKVRQQQLKELKTIQKKNGGQLFPVDVVDYARNPKSALHSAFEWDDTAAAERYRIDQARNIIRISVEVIETERETITIHPFVALYDERKHGGYRSVTVLMKTEEGRQRVLDTALWELNAFKKKYKDLKVLASVFAEIDKLSKSRAA